MLVSVLIFDALIPNPRSQLEVLLEPVRIDGRRKRRGEKNWIR
jgi:hypothetical protein